MTLNDLEIAVLQKTFETEGFRLPSIDLRKVRVISREFDPIGYFCNPEPYAISGEGIPETFSGGRVDAKLNGEIDAGFLIFIDKGFVSMIEGFVYGDAEWPNEVYNFELHVTEPTQLNKI